MENILVGIFKKAVLKINTANISIIKYLCQEFPYFRNCAKIIFVNCKRIL